MISQEIPLTYVFFFLSFLTWLWRIVLNLFGVFKPLIHMFQQQRQRPSTSLKWLNRSTRPFKLLSLPMKLGVIFVEGCYDPFSRRSYHGWSLSNRAPSISTSTLALLSYARRTRRVLMRTTRHHLVMNATTPRFNNPSFSTPVLIPALHTLGRWVPTPSS